MKKIFLLFLMLVLANTVYSQEIKKNLNFVYIVNDGKKTSSLSKELRKHYDKALRYKHPYIFYLAKGATPTIVKVNLGGDNRNEFEEKILMEIANSSSGHDVNATFDSKKIIEMFNQDDFLTQSGTLRYSKVVWTFYISESFGEEGHGEKLFPTLYWAMDLNAFDKNEDFQMYIYRPDNAKSEEDAKLLFGEKNLQDVKGFLTDYIFVY